MLDAFAYLLCSFNASITVYVIQVQKLVYTSPMDYKTDIAPSCVLYGKSTCV